MIASTRSLPEGLVPILATGGPHGPPTTKFQRWPQVAATSRDQGPGTSERRSVPECQGTVDPVTDAVEGVGRFDVGLLVPAEVTVPGIAMKEYVHRPPRTGSAPASHDAIQGEKAQDAGASDDHETPDARPRIRFPGARRPHLPTPSPPPAFPTAATAPRARSTTAPPSRPCAPRRRRQSARR